ncbi:RNA polymerase sigma factor [Sphingobacterium spiritivorum]|uniref:RNA polymerase sigma factor n=1 Tax=Sphingobacterium TaxID=28453 RepID=UPI0025D5F238|nr:MULTISPECIES: RNA polymerase sigma-70 factor [unclassified Sphingobacterium]
MESGKKSSINNLTKTDQELWFSIQTQDCQSSFALLFDRYWSLLFRTAFSYLKDKEQSEEITHDIFFNIWNKRHQLQITSFPAYLHASARYHVYKYIRNKEKSRLQFTDDLSAISHDTNYNIAIDKLESEELDITLRNILSKLPKRCQEIFIMSRFENLKNEEIAEKLQISQRTVENQITIALRHIREHLHKAIIALLVLLNHL